MVKSSRFFTGKDIIQVFGPWVGACATFCAVLISLYIAFWTHRNRVPIRVENEIDQGGKEFQRLMTLVILNMSPLPVFLEHFKFRFFLPGGDGFFDHLDPFSGDEINELVPVGETRSRGFHTSKLGLGGRAALGWWRFLPTFLLAPFLRVGVRIRSTGRFYYSRVPWRSSCEIISWIKRPEWERRRPQDT
jgi:hypothetical protein